jgi:hypothetical protein
MKRKPLPMKVHKQGTFHRAFFAGNAVRRLLFGMMLAVLLWGCDRKEGDVASFPEIPAHILEEIRQMKAPKPTVWTDFMFPTAQANLLDTNTPGIYQPTAAGTIESALYGSTRTVKRGSRFMSSFHEAIDIAPLERGRDGRALDAVRAVAAGQVAHVNTHAGNSSYGKYVVVIHQDAVGPVYSLYSHLSDVSVQKGQKVAPGDALGIMGNTATYRIPVQRSHLHFEIGVMLNRNFDAWFRKKKLTPSHGNYNGWNLLGVNPYDFIAARATNRYLEFGEFLQAVPVVFECVVRSARRPDYFELYPALWQDGPYQGAGCVIAFSENGVPLRGRNARVDELEAVGKKRYAVLSVNEELVGRNGRRLFIKRKGRRVLGSSGRKHLDMMLH